MNQLLPEFHGRKTPGETRKGEKEEIPTTVSGEEKAFYSLHSYHGRNARKRSTKIYRETGHSPSRKMEESIFPGNGLRKRENLDSDPKRDIPTNPRH